MRKTLIAATLAAVALPAITPVMADPPRWAPAHGYRNKHGDIDYRRTDNGIRYWRGEDGRYYCRRGDGTVGLLVGAALGALLGRAIDTHGERVTGTVLGAAAGALIGNELAKGPTRCR
ncbi:glycine zipper 2TM domain-containing protein [Novosphingobium sp.]|uniref:glycine zipper 2TM domain-containing protein n=1 Tax=Novosphingobium sp. TaxID=1874826 RepID=UPI0035AF0D70